MRLSILLLGLICVVWSQLAAESSESFESESEEYINLWRETLVEADATAPIINCANDGFFSGVGNNGNCSCKPNFVNDKCSQRICQNAGQPRNTLNNYGCRCPPGFSGSSCEPVKCVSGSSNSYFQAPAQQSISLLIMYNADFMFKSANDMPTQAFCDSFQSGNYAKAYVQIGNDAVYGIESAKNSTECMSKIQTYLAAACVDDDKKPIPCPDTDALTYQMILTTVEHTLPNSQVFIVSTIPVNDTNTVARNVLLAKATANRIQIHALMYAQPTIQFDDYYNTDVYKDTRSLVAATFGYFVTPYSAASKNLYAQNDVTQTLTKLATLKSSGFETIFLIKSNAPPLPISFIGGSSFYLAFRTMDISQQDDNTLKSDIIWIPASTTMSLEFDTGFFKIYKVTQAPGDTLATVQLGTNNLANFNIYILSKEGMKSYAAITTDLSLDAYSPYGLISGVSHTLAVNALNINAGPINKVNVYTSESSASLVFNPNSVPRPGCQFSIVLGDIQCHDNLPVTILLQDQSQRSAAIPFYCVDSDIMIENVNNQARRMLLDDETSTDATFTTTAPQTPKVCTDSQPSLVKTASNRSFVIISRQTSDVNSNISSVYNLYVKPGNVFEKLVAFNSKQTFYTNYVSNLVTTNNPVTNTQGSSDFADYLSSVMDQAHTAEDNTMLNPSDNQLNQIIDWKQAIDGLDYNNDGLKSFSDVFIVIDSNLTTPIKDRALLEKLYGLRLRLYFILVQVNGNTFLASDDLTISYTDLAFRTGGAVVTVPGFDEALKFFDTYFASLSGLDVVTLYKKTDSFFVKPLDTFWLTNQDGTLNYYLHVYADQPVQSVQFLDGNTPVTALSVDVASPIYRDQYLTIFKIVGSYTKAKITYKIQFPTNAENINIVLLVSGVDTLLTNVAFTSDAATYAVSGSLQFGWPSKQFPVAIAPSKPTLTLQNWNNGLSTVVMSPADMTARVCTGAKYNYFTNYDWACDQSDNLYYARLDFTAVAATHTRTQLFTCIEGEPCLHGGTQNADKTCSCPVGWIGGVCETPVCLNNGVIQSDKTCNCTDGYQGFFCELSLSGCSNQPAKPDLRNVITSVAFVIDQNSPSPSSLPDFSTWNLPGVQLVVVKLGCGMSTPSVILSTTDASLLKNAFTYSQCNEQTTFDNLADAIVLALDSVVGDRSLIVAYTGLTDATHSQKWNVIRNRLTKQRSEFRIYSTAATVTPDLHLLAQYGNGIVVQAGQDSTMGFSDYISKYVYALFSTALNPIPSQLSVVQSGSVSESDSSTTSVIIQSDPNDNTPTTIIIHVWNTTVGILTNDPVDTSANPIVFTTTNNVAYTITLAKANGKYSVEKLSNIQYSFGFQSDGKNEQLRLGLSPGDNFMSLYYSNVLDGHDVSQLPDIRLTTITDNGTSTTLVPTTHKDNNHTGACAYSFYAANLVCNDAQTVYIAQVQSVSTGKIARQNQNTFVCPSVDASSCVNGNLANGICACTANWEGVFCSLPICQNGGTREGQVCVCPVDTSGAVCELNQVRSTTTKLPITSTAAGPVQSTKTPGHTRAFAFIMDTHGQDDTLYNTSETIVREFMSMYAGQDTGAETTLIYVLSDNNKGAHAFVNYGGPAMLNAVLTDIRSSRDWSGQPPDLINAYQFILTASNSYTQKPLVSVDALTTVKNFAFYVTSINASLSDPTAVTSLKNDFNFNMKTIGNVRYDLTEFPDTTQLDVFSPVNVCDNWYQAVTYMTNTVGSADFTEPPAPTSSGRQPSCVSAVQSNIYLSLEIVNTPAMPNYRGKMYDFARLFPTDFAVVNLPTGMKSLNETYRQQTLLNGWDCYDTTCTTNAGYCTGYYPTFLKNTQTKVAKASVADTNRSMTYISFFLSDSAPCSRFDDPDTFRFVVWLWITDLTDAEPWAASLINNNYYHIFLPFDFDIDPQSDGFSDSFVGQLLAHNAVLKPGLLPTDMFIPKEVVASGTTTTDMLVQQVWTMICRVSNVIGPTATAAPPGPMPAQSAVFYESDFAEDLY